MRKMLPLLFLWACATAETQAPPRVEAVPTQSAPAAALAPPSSAPTSAQTLPASAPTTAPSKTADKLPRKVIATFVDGERPIIACGIMAFIGVYVYEVESVEEGEPLSGKITVDVLCPNFYLAKVRFKKGERHLLTLEGAKKTYAGATPPKSPQPDLPRYSAKGLQPTP